MIRSFDWRDFNLLRRLSGQGICLDTETGLIRGMHSVPSAVLSFVAPVAGAPTLVYRCTEDGRRLQAFGQLRHRIGNEIARLLYVAPAAALSSPAGDELLEALCREAVRRRAHNLLAEIGEGEPGFEALRSFSFAIYARQDVYRLAGPAKSAPRTDVPLRPRRSVDEFGIRTLYANTVPRLVQQVEPPPSPRRSGFVHAQGGEVLAYFDVAYGPLGIWVEPFFHPAARSVDDLIAKLTERLEDRAGRPVYFCVRSYLDWVHMPLQRLGCELWAEQAVMVKRLAVPLAEPESVRTPVLEGQAKMTAPFVKTEYNGHGRGSRA